MTPDFTKILQIDPTSYGGLSTSDHLSYVPWHTRLDHLHFIKLEGVINEEDKISLAEHLLELGSWEQPLIVAKSHGNHLYKLVKIQEPMLLREGNRQKRQRSLPERKYRYEFVKVEEGCSDHVACPRHAHMSL